MNICTCTIWVVGWLEIRNPSKCNVCILSRQVLVDFVTTSGSWEKVVKGDLCKLFEHYRGQGVGQIGMFGFCWGALMCVSASCEYSSDIKAIALIHPSLVKDEDGDRVMTPVLVLPASGDADMVCPQILHVFINIYI